MSSERTADVALVKLLDPRWWDSLREAEAWLAQNQQVPVRLGCDGDNNAAWLSGLAEGVLLLFCLAWRSPEPQILNLEVHDTLVIGANTDIYRVVRPSRSLAQVPLGAPFYEFASVTPDGVTAVFETGAIKIAANGDVVWRLDTELVHDYSVTGQSLHLTFQDQSAVELDLRTGLRV
jgi:hypothetical protein